MRLAFVPEVIPAMSATMQEPMFEPIVMNIPWSNEINPVQSIAMATEVITDELWMMAVKTAPITTRSTGLPIPERKTLTLSSRAKSLIEPLIILRPTKSIPNPASMPPSFLPISFLEKSARKAPIPAKAENMIVVDIAPAPPNIPRATICAVRSFLCSLHR